MTNGLPDPEFYDDPRVGGNLYDWAVARTLDLLNSATGDLATVLYAAYPIKILYVAGQGGETPLLHSTRMPATINPYDPSMRTSRDGGAYCGNSRVNFFTNTVYHEARHAYMASVANLPGNDADGDFLPTGTMPIAPVGIVVDSVVGRTVCDVAANSPVVRAYNGPITSILSLVPTLHLRKMRLNLLLPRLLYTELQSF